LSSVWVVGRGAAGRRRQFPPSVHDARLSAEFAGYESRFIRQPRFYTNSRINADPSMSLSDLLTGRAQRNLDLLIEAIGRCPQDLISTLRLCLTAASGQMTRMVFAVTGRGKTAGRSARKVEVGSWVIGYWRPHLHFEVNVWNCFEIRALALLKALKHTDPLAGTIMGRSVADVLSEKADAFLACGDCRRLLSSVPDQSIDLVVTDPPHSDRIPYLELSEFWNSILGVSPDFENEIVISNARERNKTPGSYSNCLDDVLAQVARVLKRSGTLVILFNARQDGHWHVFRSLCTAPKADHSPSLRYVGSFPCKYSATSVVQDKRAGSLRADYALVFTRSDANAVDSSRLCGLARIPDWSPDFPKELSPGGIP
jgi:hypothetical protein